MAQNANTAGGVRINPAEGSEVTVEAGQTLTLAFDVMNESPEIISYHIQTDEVPGEWVADAPVQDAAPGTNDRVRVILRPFVNAMEGVYPMRLSLSADGYVFSTVRLSLRVLPGPPVPIAPPPVAVVPAVPPALPLPPLPPPPVPSVQPERQPPIPPTPTPPPSVPTSPVADPDIEPTMVLTVADLAQARQTPAPAPAPAPQNPEAVPLPPPAKPAPAPAPTQWPTATFGTPETAETAHVPTPTPQPIQKPVPAQPAQIVPPMPPPASTPSEPAQPRKVWTPQLGTSQPEAKEVKPEKTRFNPFQRQPEKAPEPPPPATPQWLAERRQTETRQPEPRQPEPPPVPKSPAPSQPLVQTNTPIPVPVQQTPPQVLPQSPARDLPLTDEYSAYTYQPSTQEVATDEPDERNMIVAGNQDGNDGEVFTVAPGQTLLVRLTVQNEGQHTRNYVLEDDQLLDVDWLEMRQYDISLDRNAVGELRFRLSPPSGAEPGAYPFGVRFGPSDAARRMRQFTLLIPALPAVRLSTERPVVVGAFGAGAESEFPLQVTSTGNADTAFRIGVVAADGTAMPTNPDSPYLYESAHWRYLFDQEIEEVSVPENRQPARPETVKFRLARKGIWWLGWKEKHQVTVAVTPVMAAPLALLGESALRPDASSQTTLTLKRWRILPFPAFITVPLLLLLLPLFGGGVRDVVVENGIQGTAALSGERVADENLYYVLQREPITVDPAKPARQMTAELNWTAPTGSWLSLWTDKNGTLASGPFTRSYSDTVSIPEYGITRTYTVGSLTSRQSVAVRYLPLRTNNLRITVRQKGKLIAAKEFDAPGGIAGGGREYLLSKSNGTVTLSLTNGYPNGLDVIVWMASNSGRAGVNGIATIDPKRLLPQTTLPPITITPPASGTAEIVLLTTDARAQCVRLRFE